MIKSYPYEPLVYSVEGIQGKEELLELIQSILQTLEKDEAKSFRFKIKIEAKL